MYQALYKSQEYRNQEVMGASPLHLVIMAYDLAIRSCEVKDFEKATKSITVLRDALDFDYAEVSMGLFRVYQWSLDCIRKGDYATAAASLRELREAWRITEQKLNARPQATPAYATSVMHAA